jgi:xanthine dehydrogenase iron-sulfur cluster and FAD-binding subunit A
MWQNYHSVVSVEETCRILAEEGTNARIIAGGTDLLLEMERGVRKEIKTLIDISRIKGLDQIKLDENGVIHLGPLVTHGDCAASKIIIEQAFPLAKACLQVGAPQIRNRGTVAGNLITASPANDTIPPLIAMDALVVLQSIHGQREIRLSDFYSGVRQTLMKPDEIMVKIKFPALKNNQHGTFFKLGLRKAQAISLVNCAVLLSFDEDRIIDGKITLGAVAPIIINARDAEEHLRGRILDEETIQNAAELSSLAASPIDDIRSSRTYRLEMVRVCVKRALGSLSNHTERIDYPKHPVLLRANSGLHKRYFNNPFELNSNALHTTGFKEQAIETTINGKRYQFNSGFNKSLLHLLREEAGLIGSKEGCGEGECGACTVFLDGMAVMSCLVPAVRAHKAQIVTIEGIMNNGELHPIQQAFIDNGAVQCGYCTPGFIMSSVMLLDEIKKPGRQDIKEAISGNLCRCTGYYSIVAAIEQAAQNN